MAALQDGGAQRDSNDVFWSRYPAAPFTELTAKGGKTKTKKRLGRSRSTQRVGQRRRYSVRSAWEGEIELARKAGISEATSADTASARTAAIITAGL